MTRKSRNANRSTRAFEGSGQPVPPAVETDRPRATQQGAATPGMEATAQGAVPAAGNVAEPQFAPGTIARVEHPLPSSYSVTEIVGLVAGWLGEVPERRRFTLTRTQLASCLATMLVPVTAPPPTWRALAARARRLGLKVEHGRSQAVIDRPMSNGGIEEMLRLESFTEGSNLILRTAVAAALEQLEARR